MVEGGLWVFPRKNIMETIRILQVVGTMDLGGAETFIMNIYRNIDRSKIQFDFLCHNRIESAYADEIRALGGRLYSIKGMSHVGYFKYKKSLYHFFKDHPEYKLIHSHQTDLSGIIFREAKRAGVPHRFAHSHCELKAKSLVQKIRYSIFFPLIDKYATKALACSKVAGESVFTGLRKNSFTCIPNMIDTEKLMFDDLKRVQFRNQLSIGMHPVVGHVGRFAHQKNHEFLLHIFKHILERIPSAKLLLIGAGELQDHIRQLAGDLNICDSVIFYGLCRDIPACLSGMDLFLFPSHYEGFPVAAIEAEANGLPVLTSTAVTDEVRLTDRVRQLSLSESAITWADAACDMLKTSDIDRTAYAKIVADKGFDVKTSARRVQSLYLSELGVE